MSDVAEHFIATLQDLGGHYVHNYLQDWDGDELKTDWYVAFKFLLSRLYLQGRRDELSQRFFDKIEVCLDAQFLPNPKATMKALIRDGHIPATNWWKKKKAKSANPLWRSFDATMGKSRDREMTLDALRYVATLKGFNVVNHALREIRGGNICRVRDELKDVRSVGPKTSAFFLRDVTLIFDVKLPPEQFAEIQAIDTWVVKLIKKLAAPGTDPVAFLVQHAGTNFCPARINAGAWYIGKHAFPILIDLVKQKPDLLSTVVQLAKVHG